MTTESCAIKISKDERNFTINLKLNDGWKFRTTEEAKGWWSDFFKKFFEEHKELFPSDVKTVSHEGVSLKNGHTVSHPDLFTLVGGTALTTAQKAQHVWDTLPAVSPGERELPPVDQLAINTAEPTLEKEGLAKVAFSFIDPVQEPHTLDAIAAPQRWAQAEQDHLPSRQELIDRETAYLAHTKGQAFEPNKKRLLQANKVYETMHGVDVGLGARSNYRLQVDLQHNLKRFYNEHRTEKVDTLQSDTIFAKNNPLNGLKTLFGTIERAITSSFNRFADTVTMMRKEEHSDKSSDAYAGRVDTLEKAEELSRFLFLGEIDAFENMSGLSKGIRKRPDGVYELTYSIQSLLNMTGEQGKLFEKEVEAYEQLVEKCKQKPLTILHPVTKKAYRVVVGRPLIVANQFNYKNRVEKYTPDIFSGRSKALAASAKADLRLQKLIEKRLKHPDLPLDVNAKDYDPLERVIADQLLEYKQSPEKIAQIQHALQSLQEQRLNAWQEIMTRAFLFHLLGLPEDIHCLSSVDRTGGVAIPLVWAMKRWLDSGHPVPFVDGRYRIEEIVNHEEPFLDEQGRAILHAKTKKQAVFNPFKEFFAYKMHHELKISECSRGPKGFKLKEGGMLHPALRDLLPQRYLDRGWFLDGINNDYKNVGGRTLIASSKQGALDDSES